MAKKVDTDKILKKIAKLEKEKRQLRAKFDYDVKSFREGLKTKAKGSRASRLKGTKIYYDPKVLQKYKDASKVAKVATKRATKKSLAKKVVSKLGLPGKVVVGAWTAYDIAKEFKERKSKSKSKQKAKGKPCKPGQYMNKKGDCISRVKVKNIPKE